MSSIGRKLCQVGTHEQKLREYFEQCDIAQGTPTIDEPVSILVFINRSGSSVLAEHLRATGEFSGFGEPLSHTLVTQRAEEHSLHTFQEYIDWLLTDLRKPGTQLGMKANLDQVQLLLRTGAVGRYLTNVKWIFLQRTDVLAQAISHSIAQQTNQWVMPGEVKESKLTPEYRFEEIRSLLYEFSDTYAALLALMAQNGIPFYHLTYEQFQKDPFGETAALASYLGVEEPVINPKALRLKKQGNHLNKKFRQLFIQDVVA